MNAQWDLECRNLSMTEMRRIVIWNLWDSAVENSVTLFKKLIHLPQIQADLRQMNYTNGELMIGIVEFICSNLLVLILDQGFRLWTNKKWLFALKTFEWISVFASWKYSTEKIHLYFAYVAKNRNIAINKNTHAGI